MTEAKLEGKPSKKYEFTQLIDTLAKSAAIILAFVYCSGFLIISLHQAQYGVSEFGLFRSRILFAGSLFAFLLAIPGIVAARMFSLFGYRDNLAISYKPEHKAQAHIYAGSVLYFISYYMLAQLSSFLFGGFQTLSNHLALYLGWALALMVFAVFAPRLFNRFHLLYAILYPISVALHIWLAWRFDDHRRFAIAVWYWIFGIALVFLNFVIKSKYWGTFNWENFFLASVSAMAFFASSIFGQINPRYGGGKPVEVVLYFNEATPISKSLSMNARLLEETDHGYYVLTSPDSKDSFFIRRDLVSALHFGEIPKPINPTGK